jgi:hypothetical protein
MPSPPSAWANSDPGGGAGGHGAIRTAVKRGLVPSRGAGRDGCRSEGGRGSKPRASSADVVRRASTAPVVLRVFVGMRTRVLQIRSWDAPLLMASIQAFHCAPETPKWAFPVMVCSSSWIDSWMRSPCIVHCGPSGDDKLAAKKCPQPRPPGRWCSRWSAATPVSDRSTEPAPVWAPRVRGSVGSETEVGCASAAARADGGFMVRAVV